MMTGEYYKSYFLVFPEYMAVEKYMQLLPLVTRTLF